MSDFANAIAAMKAADFGEKKQFLQYFAQMSELQPQQLSKEDKDALLIYAYEEVEHMLRVIPQTAAYKEKDVIFECEDALLGIVMNISRSPDNLPQDKLMRIKALTELVEQERYIETKLDETFSQTAITETDINRLLFWARQCTDEYQKSKLFLGLSHYQRDLDKLDDAAVRMMTDYVASELRRLMQLDSEDTWNALELLADVSKHFADDQVLAALVDLVQLGRNHINYYAVDTLFRIGADVPQSVLQPAIDALARDLEFANLTFGTLQQHGKTALFPSEYATDEYLAKSDLVRWLTYPTELGQVPDEIEYIGRIKPLLKKEVFHVFKFRSNSDTLGDDLKNKWLIGWSSNEGGTFSNFDEYALYEKGSMDATLKNIKKKLIG